MNNKQITDLLHNSDILIRNSISDGEISGRVSAYGYDAEKLNEGLTLLEEAETLNKDQNVQYAEQYEATQKANEMIENFDETYALHRDLARAMFQDEAGYWEMLHLAGRRKTRKSEWLRKARDFYSNIKEHEELLNRMSPLGFTTEYLDSRLAELDAIEEAMREQVREAGEAQQATVDRDKKIDELQDWVNIYKNVAKLALMDKPQLLEKLGLLVRSE
ncbi:hypothetical protein [Thermophagus xiamenensis]|uniref:Uncharacterized protein n=1 Tax=Thermophagus xiamenensis TaxID=385682 RepID=A0A1I2A2X8_9BACT|nr:hypothetical protein [Thermophagus xiamenensis]SFE37273.1 hypothetical protein SAMN05444380_11075 [Thermophagus xiamenensis]